MEIFNQFVRLIHVNLIKGMFVTVLVIIFSRIFFKKKFDTREATAIAKWIMIGYCLLLVIDYLLIALLSPSSKIFISSLIERATDRYRFAFWLMVLGAISPLILLFKKFGNKVYLILVLTIFMNIGWLMESLVIYSSILYRGDFGENRHLIFYGAFVIILQGLIVGVLLLVIGNFPFFRRNAVR